MSIETSDKNPADIYPIRATEKAEPPSSLSIPVIRDTRDRVYNGTTAVQAVQGLAANDIHPRRNRKQEQRKISPFNIVLLLIGTAIVSVLYISNILTVGRLLIQIDRLQTTHQRMQNEKEALAAQINRLSNLERIQQLAQDQLGMENPKHLPLWLQIDPERINQVDGAVQRRTEKRP